MWTIRTTAMLGMMGALALPVAAFADPPAVGNPTIPPVFVGAPTNDNPNAGQFTVNFDSTGTYLGTGIAPEPPLTRDLTPDRNGPVEYVQAGSGLPAPSVDERQSVDGLFVGFQQQLREIAGTQTAYRR